MAAPTFVAASASNDRSALGSRTLALPAGIAVGDMMLAIAETNAGFTFDTPAGWTLIAAHSGAAFGDATATWFYKVVDSGDIGASVTWSAPGGGSTNAAVVAYRGSASTPHAHSVYSSYPTTGGTLTANPVTTTVSDCTVVDLFARDTAPGSGVGAAPITVSAPLNNRTGSVMGTAVGDEVYAAAGTTTARTATCTNSSLAWSACTVALAPAGPTNVTGTLSITAPAAVVEMSDATRGTLDTAAPSATVNISGVSQGGVLALTAPAASVALTGSVPDVTSGALAVTAPAARVSLAGGADDTVRTSTANALNGRIRRGFATVETEVAVTPAPATVTRGHDFDKAVALTTPTLVDGRPT